MKRLLTTLLGLALASKFVLPVVADFGSPPVSGPVVVANNAALEALPAEQTRLSCALVTPVQAMAD